MRVFHITLSLVAIWVLLLQLVSCTDATDGAEAPSAQRKLSRRKRYLIFPEGSSFQLVYDQIIPIVDYTNLFIFGVTTALAWPLPDKPIDDAKLRDMFANGTLIPFRRIDDAPTVADVDNNNAPSAIDTVATNELNSGDRPQDSYYKRPAYSSRISQIYGQDDLYYARRPYPEHRPWPQSVPWSQKPAPTAPVVAHRRHMIYPALGKRSVRQISDPLDQLSVLHHRHTRHELYASIERYLDAQQLPGAECVRRALCETSRKRRDTEEPGSFVGELLRVVFSLPDVAVHEAHHRRLRREDGYHEAAHGGLEEADDESCAQRYAQCEHSVWESVFVI